MSEQTTQNGQSKNATSLDDKQRAPEPERDRRGVILPARQRVGGIITPQ